MYIAIVEDSKKWAEDIKSSIQQILKQRVTEIKIYSSAEEFLRTRKEYSIVFMDINLKKMNGLEAAKRYKLRFFDCLMIMVSMDNRLYREGYKVGAFRFIDKANLKEELEEALEHAIIKFSGYQMMEVFALNEGKVQIAYKDIIYIETDNRKVKIHTPERVYKADGKITELAKQLESEGFYRSDKSYLVNLDWIKEMVSEGIGAGKLILMRTGEKVPIGIKKKKELLVKLYEYKFIKENG